MTGPRWLHAGGARLEAAWHGPAPDEAPTLVFLHEGLGSVSRWRGVPAELAERTGCGALVYSRAGYGKSDPVPLPRPVRFMHDEAATLGEVLRAAGVREAILVGHSDGGSIALLYAASETARAPGAPALLGLALEAPHVFVEDLSVASIAAAAERYRTTDMRERLAKHHGANTDVAFRGWNDVWLDPDFRAWNIEGCLGAIDVPVLILQGAEDEYGSWAQVEAIERGVAGTVRAVRLAGCGHAPHKDRREDAVREIADFALALRERRGG